MHISGAVGICASLVNGFYQPTDEKVGKASVYKKLGDDDMWIEYYAPEGRWIGRSAESRGSDAGFISCLNSPPLPLEQCPLGDCWKVFDGSSFVKQSSLSVSVSTMLAFQAYVDAQVD